MSPPVRVALLGFTPFEREHIEPALRAPRDHKPVYRVRIDALASCNLAIVDADHEAALGEVLHQKRLASTVLVGSAGHPGAGAQLPRPIHLPSLLLALDELVTLAPPMSAGVQQVQDMLASLRGRHAPGRSPPAAATTARTGVLPGMPGADTGPQSCRGTALLVDGHDDNLEALACELARLGLDIQRAAGGSQALARLQQHVFEFVFLATGDSGNTGNSGGSGTDGADGADGADGMDGFHTCRLLQRLPPAQPVAPPPTLVLLLAGDTAIDRLRAERAGADAWLPPPWASEALLKIVDERDRWLRQCGKRAG